MDQYTLKQILTRIERYVNTREGYTFLGGEVEGNFLLIRVRYVRQQPNDDQLSARANIVHCGIAEITEGCGLSMCLCIEYYRPLY